MSQRRGLAVAFVCASACGAYETAILTETSQDVAIINMDNPYTFMSTPLTHPFTVTVQNSSDSDDITSITPGGGCGNFQLMALGLPAHICGISGTFAPGSAVTCPQNYSFMVTYVGNSTESCLMGINWVHTGGGSGSGSGTFNLMLNSSIAVGSAFTVSPSQIDFGQIGSGTTSSSELVTVTNTGGTTLTISGAKTGAAYTVTPVGAATLNPHMLNVGSAEGYKVTCTPPDIAMYNGSLTFTAGTIIHSSTFMCEGVNSGITITPSQVSFPSTLVGRPPPDQQVTITGSAATTITSITLDSTAMGNNVSISQAPPMGTNLGSGGAIVGLHYAADRQHDAGSLGKLLVLASSDTVARQVGISGEAQPGSIGTNPAAVELGPVCATGSGAVDVEVFANAAGTVVLQAPAMPTSPFMYSTTATFPATLRGNHLGGTMLTVSAHPSAVGEVSSMLDLVTDIPGAGPYELPLHATVLAEGVAATPAVVHFGTIDPNSSTSGREVKLTNCGTAPIMVTGATIVGANAKEFVLVAPTDPTMTLMPAQSETFLVIMSSHDATGDKSATLHILHDTTATDADLEGSVGGAKDRETYYGCSVAAGGSSAALLVFVVVVVTRRRRRVR